MTKETVDKITKEKVNDLMIPIVEYFETNKNLTYSELSNNWEDFKTKLNLKRFEVVCDILTNSGIKDPFKENSDNEVKATVVTFSPLTFDETINDYYYTKIKPIIIQKL